jgi:hypothetical protein
MNMPLRKQKMSHLAGHSRKKKTKTWAFIDYSSILINGRLRKAYGTIREA